jgi:small subunit ribosomal protein S3
MKAGALGCELRLSGKLPSERAKSWRFSEGYLKKSGQSSKEVDRAQAVALTKLGISGIKVAIMSPEKRIYDQIQISEDIKNKIKQEDIEQTEEKKEKKTKKPKVKKEKSKGAKE